MTLGLILSAAFLKKCYVINSLVEQSDLNFNFTAYKLFFHGGSNAFLFLYNIEILYSKILERLPISLDSSYSNIRFDLIQKLKEIQLNKEKLANGLCKVREGALNIEDKILEMEMNNLKLFIDRFQVKKQISDLNLGQDFYTDNSTFITHITKFNQLTLKLINREDSVELIRSDYAELIIQFKESNVIPTMGTIDKINSLHGSLSNVFLKEIEPSLDIINLLIEKLF